ncbi:choice-of-anchor C family protein [Streptomyces fenghuangensis]|uniref:choice-of-anchor C family protein n=1 Tax=Streptomyces sp. ICN903 TaxID=2964654 RepID=UPI001EDC1AF1|nr:choice-of-anchor C family protein [Streptomyces sp. ICN903]MCG3039251.1 choice-of-anchor C family protein [Streptomyces sp. ICN903]
MLSVRTHIAAAIAACLLAGTGTAVAAPSHSPGRTGQGSESTIAVSRFDGGSFEYPAVGANTFRTIGSGQPVGPWRVTSGAVDLIGAGFWQAAEGDQSVDLNATTAGTVAQTFTTTPGRTYTVTYSLAGNPEGNPSLPRTGRALVDGQNFQDFSFDVTGRTRADMGYVTRQFTFVANNDTTTLAFASTVGGAYGPVIDDVRVHSCCPDSCCR